MGTIQGKFARMLVGGNEIKLNDWSLDLGRQTIDTTTGLDAEWDTSDAGGKNYTVTLNTNLLEGDPGHEALIDAYLNNTRITDLKLYTKYVASPSTTDPATYWEPDTNHPDQGSEAHVIVESYRENAARNGVIGISLTLRGSGPIKRTVATA